MVSNKNQDNSDLGPEVPGRCNARKRQGPPARCRATAGKGTDHVGTGSCSRHGGSTPSGRQAGELERHRGDYARAARRRFGEKTDITPAAALLDELAEAVAFAAYLKDQIAETTDPQTGDVRLVDPGDGTNRAAPAVLVALWNAERDRVAKFAKMALDAGATQAQIDLIVSYQNRVLDLVEDIARDLGHDPDDPHTSRIIAGRLAIVAATASANLPPPPPVSVYDEPDHL